ncbi:MAG: fibronectin type III domain-containing protein [Candidatus Neomarinimicrobiota bacterium]
MPSRHILAFLTSLLLLVSCSEDNPLAISDRQSAVTVAILLEDGDGEHRGDSSLGKISVISRVVVTVSAADMETIEEDLTLSSGGETASGSFEVPKGKSRTFTVEAVDANGITQYSGSTTQDILNDGETVSITTEGHYPSPVSLTVGTVFVNSVKLTWTRSADVDFQEYEIYRSTTSTVDLNSTLIATINSKLITSYVDETLDLNTSYSYRIIVWDTEELGYWGSVVTTPAELGYDDGVFEQGLIATEQDEGLLVLFTAPSYPASLVAVEMAVWGTQDFEIYVWDWETGDILDNRAAEGVDANDYEWAYYDRTVLDLDFSGDFYVGLVYTGDQQNDGTWWPAIALDETASARRSYDLLSTSFDLLDDVGFPGNLAIRAVVEVNGGILKLAPAGLPTGGISPKSPGSHDRIPSDSRATLRVVTPRR